MSIVKKEILLLISSSASIQFLAFAFPNYQISTIRYLVFQPLVTDVRQRPKTPPDHGYYFKFNTNAVTLIKYLLEDNGFRESNNSLNFSIMWSNGAIKNEVYQCLGYYQKVFSFVLCIVFSKYLYNRSIISQNLQKSLEKMPCIEISHVCKPHMVSKISTLSHDLSSFQTNFLFFKP